MVHTDCFAYHQGITQPKCSAMKYMVCKEKECKFYKPTSEITQAQIEHDILVYNSLRTTARDFEEVG